MAHASPRRRNCKPPAAKTRRRRRRLFETLELRALLTGATHDVWVNGAWLDATSLTPASLTPGESVTDNIVTKTYGLDAFSTVQSGVAAVEVGGAVHVDPGLYAEDLDLAKDLTIDAAGNGPAILQSQSGGAAITVEPGVSASLAGLEIRNSLFAVRVNGGAATISGAAISGNTFGVYVTGGSATISSSQIYDDTTGLRYAGGAIGSLASVNFAGGMASNNGTDLLLAATAGTVTIGAGNSFAGATTIHNQTSHEVDAAAGNSFAGVNLADLDPATAPGLAGLYTIEDHIADGLDQTGAGLVRLKTGDVFLAATSEAAQRNSLQRAVDLASADDTVSIQAGAYIAATNYLDAGAGLVVELNIDKPLSLMGPNVDFDPLTAIAPAYPQAIILPGASDPDPGDTAAVSVVGIRADQVTIRGLTIDGANPALAGDPHSMVYNGAAIDALDAISCLGGHGNLTIDHNVIQNASYTGIDLEDGSMAAGTTNVVSANRIANIGGAAPGFGAAVYLANNFYAAVTDNRIATALLGVQTQGFTAANPAGPGTAQIAGNTIAAVGSGIWYNDFSAAASPFDVSGNTITAVEDAASMSRWIGILISSATGATFTGNTIDGSATAANQSQTSYGVKVTSGGAATIADSLIENNDDGVYTDGGGAVTVTGSNILANRTGIEIADASLTSATNNFISGGQIGILIHAAATAVGPIGGGSGAGNSIAGHSLAGLRNDSPLSINAAGNWWGSADGPNSPANAYLPDNAAGDAILGEHVSLAPWLTVGTNTATAQYGFQPTALDASPPSFSGQSNQTATERQVQSIDLGSFSDAENAAAGPWHVVADWGDGGPVEGFNVAAAGALGSRSHTYADEGHHTVAMTIVEQAGTSGSTTFDVTVLDALPSITAASGSVSAAEKAVAHNSGSYSDYDDTLSVAGPGVIDNHDGTWTWSGTGDEDHPYDVTVTATNSHGSQSTTTFNVSFMDVPPSVSVASGSVAAAEGSLAHNSGGYADIDDGVSVSGPGVTDHHDGTWTWSGAGDEDHPYDVSVTATNSDGAQATTTFHVSFIDIPPTVSAASGLVTATEGSVAHNSGMYNDVDDAVSVAGLGVTDNHDGTWMWSGTGEENVPYDVTVTATNAHGGQSSTTFHVSFTDAPLAGSSTATAGGTEGLSGSSVLSGATFTNGNPGDHTADFTAMVHWGDNTSSPGGISHAGGVYTVNAAHTYAEEGSFDISIDVADAGGSTTVLTGLATVADPPVAATGGFLVHAPIQTDTGMQTVATFTDPGGLEDPSADYSATIDWGDATPPTAGTIAYEAMQGLFIVQGSHTYASANAATYQIQAAIHHEASAVQMVASMANVASLSLDLSGSSAAVSEGSPFTLVLGGVHDSNPNEAGEITGYDIDWGDGSAVESYAFSGAWAAGAISRLHTYADGPASPTIHVSLHDASGLRANVGSLGVSVLNAAPTASLVNFGSVSEGSAGFVTLASPHDASAVDQGAGFTYRYDFDNDGVFDFTTTAANQIVTVPALYLAIGPADRVVRGRIGDKDGGFTDYTTTIHVNNVAPIVTVAGDLATDQGVAFSKPGSFADPGSDAWTAQVNYGDGSGWQPLALGGNKTFTLGHSYESAAGSPYLVSVQVTDHGGTGAGALTGTGTFHVTVNPPVIPPTLQVMSFAGSASGFDITLSHPVDTSKLNLYGGSSGGRGAADVTMTNQQTGAAVRGSLVWDAATNTAHFVATGGLLPPGVYSVDLASRSDGWTDTSGAPLDGAATGTAGSGDFTRTFSVPAPSVPVLSLPDFARGPGQNVNVNADGTARSPYLPIRLNNTSGVTSLSFEIDYDPALLNVTGALKAAGLPADWSVNSQVTKSGGRAQLMVTASGTTALSAGPRDVVDLVAQVPATAPYRAAQLLKPVNVLLNSGNIGVVVDEAVQKVAYFGDATGDGTLSGFDASFISRNVVQIDDGFSAYPLTDPRIVADVTGDGSISGLDASVLASASVGNPEPTVPAVPGHSTLPTAGIDPMLTVPIAFANPGGTVTVPISISELNGLQGVDLAFSYDGSAVNISDADITVTGAAATEHWNITTNCTTPGLIRLSMYGLNPLPETGPGTIADLTFHVPMSTAGGNYPVSVVTNPIGPSTTDSSRLNEGLFTLSTQNGFIVVADPLMVVNTNDDGVGSLRHVIQYANGLPGPSHTITFAIPAGSQTINLLSPLSASTVPLTVVLGASQNAIVNSPTGGGQNAYSALSKIGAGSLTIAGDDNLTGNVEVSDGTLRFDVSTPPTLVAGFTPTVDGAGTLDLAGTVSAFSGGNGGTNISNNSTAVAGVLATGTNQTVGGIDGIGTVAVADDATLTASHIVQGGISIGGSAGHLATLTIDASDDMGNSLAATASGTSNAGGLLTSDSSRRKAFAAREKPMVCPNILVNPVPDTTATTFASGIFSTADAPATDDRPASDTGSPISRKSIGLSPAPQSPGVGVAAEIAAMSPTTSRPPQLAAPPTVAAPAWRSPAARIDESLLDLLALDRGRPHRGRLGQTGDGGDSQPSDVALAGLDSSISQS